MVTVKESEGGDFEVAPQGLHQAVCIDVIDLGLMQTAWGPKHRVRIRWAIDAQNSRGYPFWISATYNLTLGTSSKPSGLRKALESWRGKQFTDEEVKCFDLDKVIGANCQLQVIHRPGDGGKVWANVQAVVPIGKNMVPMRVPADYVRVGERPPQGPPPAQPPDGSRMELVKSYDPPGAAPPVTFTDEEILAGDCPDCPF